LLINYRIQTHEYNTLAVTQEVLCQLNEMAIKRNYNRSLKRGFFPQNRDWLDNVDIPADEMTDRVVINGIPIQCEMAVPHYHAQGKLVMPHVRAVFKVPTVTVEEYTQVFVIEEKKDVSMDGFDTIEWVTVTVDIPGTTWENLPTVRPYAWIDVPETHMYETALYEKAEKKFAEDANVTIEQVEEYLGKAEKDFFNNLGNEEE